MDCVTWHQKSKLRAAASVLEGKLVNATNQQQLAAVSWALKIEAWQRGFWLLSFCRVPLHCELSKATAHNMQGLMAVPRVSASVVSSTLRGGAVGKITEINELG